MKSRLLASFLIAALLTATPAIARHSVPIVNYNNVAVATSRDQALAADQVKQAILAAATTKGWSIAYQPDGKLLATLNVRNKHTIVVEIAYTANSYSLTYKDSTNMNYAVVDSERVIHPNYNKWVQDLSAAIRGELLKL